jgi:Spy/CpxP family protein refolding chaperone
MSLIRAIALTGALVLAVPAFAADTAAVPALTPQQTADLQQFLQQVRAAKRQLITDNLTLTTDEGNGFWPIYEQYQSELQKNNKRLFNTIKAYADAYNAGPVSDEAAKKLIREAFASDEADLKLRKKFLPKIEKVLPAAKAARYIQIESKIRAAIRYEIAAGVPLVE